MRGVRTILPTLFAVLAMLSASAWSGPASACLSDSATNVVGGAPSAMASHQWQHQQHHMALRHRAPFPASGPGGPAGPRMDCAACIAVLPPFPSVGSHDLMPFMPTAQSFEPLSGIVPALDPPPPRPARP